MKKQFIIVVLLLILTSCSHEYWATTSKRADQGKYTVRNKAWTKNTLCKTYDDRNIQQSAYVRRHHFYRYGKPVR